MVNRRSFVKMGSLAAGASMAGACASESAAPAAQAAAVTSTGPAGSQVPPSIAALTSMRDQAQPITAEERRTRIEKARRLMTEQKIDALMLTGGTSLAYFSGMQWGLSERLFAMVLPVQGEAFYVCPAFEEERAREQIAKGPLGGSADVRTWEEHENPYQRVSQGLRDRGIAAGSLGIEETVRFVFSDGVSKAAPTVKLTSGTPISAGCRITKDAHELALMRLAAQVTLKAYEAAWKALKDGMTQDDFASLVALAHRQLGFEGGAGVQVGQYSALPHGSITPQVVREGSILLIDGGCSVEGYVSDISRTFVLGKATDKMKQVFDIEYAGADGSSEGGQAGRPVRGSRCRRAQGDRRRGIRAGLQILHPPCRPRHGDGRSRVAIPRQGQHAPARARYDLQRRAGHLHSRRVRRPPRGRYGDYGERRRADDAAEPVTGGSVRRASNLGQAKGRIQEAEVLLPWFLPSALCLNEVLRRSPASTSSGR